MDECTRESLLSMSRPGLPADKLTTLTILINGLIRDCAKLQAEWRIRAIYQRQEK